MNEHPQLELIDGPYRSACQGHEPMIGPERAVLNGFVSYRYRGPDADHALIVQPGPAPHDGLLELFCAHHAAQGVDVWAIAATPKRRFIPDRLANASIMLGQHISQHIGLPVFMIGTGPGAAVAHRAVHASDAFWGAVLVGCDHDIACPITEQDNPASASLTDNMPRPTEQPGVGATRERSPIVCIVGENETFGPTEGHAATCHIEVYRHGGELDELLGSPGALSDIALDWSLHQFSNHFNPKWSGFAYQAAGR